MFRLYALVRERLRTNRTRACGLNERCGGVPARGLNASIGPVEEARPRAGSHRQSVLPTHAYMWGYKTWKSQEGPSDA